MRAISDPLEALAAKRGRLLPWAPFCLAVGIGGYFVLPAEPTLWIYATASILALACFVLLFRGPEYLRVSAIAVALIAGGGLLAGARAHLVAAPVLGFRYYGPVEGRIVDIDRSFSDQVRLTLDRVVLEDVAPDRTPAKVRVSLHGDQTHIDPVPGLVVMMTAHLSPPQGPGEPGGFDFQRLAWFSRLGAVGYTRAPVLIVAPPETGTLRLATFRVRMALSRGMQAQMEGQAGAFAAAMMTGDRSGVTAATNQALRASNLYHIISISGLHMGLLSGFVFALCRFGIALVPPVALRINAKKVAAALALAAAVAYLAVAGPDVATRRAFIMAAVMLIAVLADRRAISLRSLAISALVCLLLEPESLVEPGFQMSFGATIALVVAFEQWTRVQGHVPALLRPVAVLLLSSLVAGWATAPIAAAHFNRIAEYGLMANLLAAPLMGAVVMPAGVIAAILAPFGLAAPALWAMEQGTALMLQIAFWVAGLEGSVIVVPAPGPWVLPLLAIGGFGLLVPRGLVARGFGAAVLALSMGLWTAAERPDLLIDAEGALVGLLGAEGRAVSKPKGAGFVAEGWLENDGDSATQEEAAARPGFSGERGARRAEFAGRTLWHFTGKKAQAAAGAACSAGALVVAAVRWEGSYPEGDCLFFDQRKLELTGAIAVFSDKAGPVFVTAAEVSGKRLWNQRAWHRAGRERGAKSKTPGLQSAPPR